MNGRKLVRELPLGLLVLALMLVIAGVVYMVRRTTNPSATMPPPGETLTGAEAERLHPNRRLLEGGADQPR